MKQRDKVIRLKHGKYRYRGHIIWTDDVLRYWCSPDPSDLKTYRWSLREVVQYIDKWEAAFEDGRVHGNKILSPEMNLEELASERLKSVRDPMNAIISLGELSRYIMKHVKRMSNVTSRRTDGRGLSDLHRCSK